MGLSHLTFPPVMDTSSSDLIADFFMPALRAATRYDRGVGYFSSGWLRETAAGMADFAANGGRARWVTSPILDERDWQALSAGAEAHENAVLHEAMRRGIENLARQLAQDTLSALAWLVADGVLSFRLAVPRNKLERGNFHDKFGIFTDRSGEAVSFSGSYNDSIQGLRNYESIKIFSSRERAFASLVVGDAERFERLWNNLDPNVQVFDLPEAAHEQILQLRTNERPYRLPAGWEAAVPPPIRVVRPHIPEEVVLREYQLEAIAAWYRQDCRGLLEMATGTGKTITALAAAARLYEREGRLALIITVPYQHLVDQWQEDAKRFAFQPLLAYKSRLSWYGKLAAQVRDFVAGHRQVLSVITTHTTFATEHFQQAIAKLGTATLLIADEAHHLGAEQRRGYYPAQIPFRLALSATPDRWFDDDGTAALREYFGETAYEYPLERAIGTTLTPYYYYPHLVSLTDEEMERYAELSTKIQRLMGYDDEERSSSDALRLLLIQRANLLNRAENKLRVLAELVDGLEKVDHALFYCAPGQIDEVMPLLGIDKGLQVHRFTAEEDTRKRRQLLADFDRGLYQGLVAMRCLDEGVDVPSTRTAFILASSSNPREFIQRRGRILRRSAGKDFAIIHDLMAIPPDSWAADRDSPMFSSERGIVRRELQRFKEFANPALNKHEALDGIWDVARRYGLMDF